MLKSCRGSSAFGHSRAKLATTMDGLLVMVKNPIQLVQEIVKPRRIFGNRLKFSKHFLIKQLVSPLLACRINPRATVAAVVERSVKKPMLIGQNPLSLAVSISSLVQPPSGPIAKQVFCGLYN
ncbi:MAG: hypothetical protein CM1200mP24_07680 [Gammaproteobacteria bacterium]|nr:MAG: hypothetical protein CM1200mP24_07680 [Gammaproteobacteria bacterium]